MKILDLFAGIGGFSLAGHWLGWETVAFVEWAEFQQKVLKKNFPGVPVFGDIREFNGKKYYGKVDIICGGFPCQPFSSAGKRKGKEDDRFLWPEMLRVIREVQPDWIVGENVAGILSMDGGSVFEEICADLESEGYDVQPFVIPACATGAPHRRDRVWIVANSSRKQNDATEQGRFYAKSSISNTRDQSNHTNSNCTRLQSNVCLKHRSFPETPGASTRGKLGRVAATPEQWKIHWLQVATELCRVDDGVPSELDELRNADRTNRLKALGNAIVPQVAYEIFCAIENLPL